MGFKRPGVQIAPLGPKNDRKSRKKQLFGHFFIAKILCNIAAYSPITKAVAK